MINITTPQIILTVVLSLLGLILLLFTLAIVLRVKITLKIEEELSLFITFLGVRFKILPKKKKKYRLSRYTLKKIRAREEKAERRKKKRAERAEREKAKKEQRNKKKKKKKGTAKKTEKKTEKKSSMFSKSDIPDALNLFIDILKITPKTFLSRFHFHVAKLHLTIGSDNAAKTAIIYGAIAGALYPTLEFFDRHSNLHKRNADIFIEADYTAEKITFRGNVAFSMSVLGLLLAFLKLGIKLLVGGIKILAKSKDDSDGENTENNTENKEK